MGKKEFYDVAYQLFFFSVATSSMETLDDSLKGIGIFSDQLKMVSKTMM